jgi:hypothetical protein
MILILASIMTYCVVTYCVIHPTVKVRKRAPAPEIARIKFEGVVDRACKKKSHFIHFQLQNNAPICPQITSKVKLTLGKIIPVPLKYLIFAMQNKSSCGTPHGSD